MNNKKILLTIAPPFWPKTPPVGIGYLQAFLEKNDTDCDILDLNNIFYNLSSPELKKSWLVSCNTLLEKTIFDLLQKNNPEEFKKLLGQMLQYDIVGFSCFKSNISSSLKLADLLKSRNENIKIIFGGPEIARQFFKTSGCFTENIGNLADFMESLNFIIKNKSLIPKIEQINPFTYYDGISTKKAVNKDSLKRLDIFTETIKSHGLKYTNAFIGNLIEKTA